MRLLIEDGRVLDPGRRLDAVRDVLIEEGVVREVAAGLRRKLPAEGLRVIAAKGLWVLPGLIDIHVHLREPGREKDETVQSGTRAAAAGGVTTVLAMPNTDPPTDDAAKVRWVSDRAKEDGLVNVLVAGAVSKGRSGEQVAPLGGMAEAGAAAFSDDGKPVATAALLRRALEYAKLFGTPVIDHCEDPGLSAGGCMHEGRTSFRLGLPGIPAASEAVAAWRDIEVARLTGGRLHIAHVSCASTVAAVRLAKSQGVAVTAEACPHHFTLSDAAVSGEDADFKMNPPLRARADVEAVIEGLADGTLDAIASDHAPHSPERKARPFQHAPFGILGLETLVPLSLELVRKKALSPSRWAALLTSGPAGVLGLRSKGTLAPGAAADITIVDPGSSWLYEKSESRSRNSPFLGKRLRGRALFAWVAGKPVLENGALVS